MDSASQGNKYAEAEQERQKYVDTVVVAPTRNKIVVAGPGTGKTYLFRHVLNGKENTLTLTFVNALLEDLSLELFGLSEVRTLHSFARQQLEKVKGKGTVKIFPKLSAVIKQDAVGLLDSDVDFNSLFHNKSDHDEHIEFYRKRRVYYKHYGFSDIVYAVVRLFETNPDRIPTYSQVVVDEFQDFNALEVALIEQLASKSPMLLAGDDDQALYETLKNASTRHIRQRHGDSVFGYERFKLPYCSRCTRVIVDSTNDIISGAARDGYLRDRIDKPFWYFEHPEKDRESDSNPLLVYSKVYAKQIPWFIQERVKEIAKEVRDKFTVLLISPTRIQSREIVNSLREKGFENVHYFEKEESQEPILLEGLNLLLEDSASNLGWRVVAKTVLPDAEFKSLLEETAQDNDPPRFCDIMPAQLKKDVKKLLKYLRAVRDGKWSEDETQAGDFLNQLGINPIEIAIESLRDHISPSVQRLADHGIRKVFMQATTIASSKGLAADYVFITHFDDQYFIRDTDKRHVTDQDICSFLVALTRARRKVFLISSDKNKKPSFLEWIDKAHIQTVK